MCALVTGVQTCALPIFGQSIDLGRHRAVHRSREPRPRAVTVEGFASRRASPFGDTGGKYLRARPILAAMRFMEAVDVLRLPEIPPEPLVLPRALLDTPEQSRVG